ncbi:glycoside hydrolase family 13 protein [Algivirga pacifica]|uniref:Glycoside hydrolase family 13 protein n=1 Tax=Algivirga pacifica TaxID=1162670 RepID=A0ABP9D3F2_9BACT
MNKLNIKTFLLASAMLAGGCATPPSSEQTNEQQELRVPTWAKDAVWYQIFVERFRNGDTDNDPTLETIKGSNTQAYPENWAVTPWEQDWYKPDPWADELEGDFYSKIQHRRYGGDLQGVLDKLDYLEQLGVTAIYFNPLNDAPSLHKYDVRNYRHIDVNFGPDPEGDMELMATEDPENPETWKWTSADLLFLELVEEAHNRGIRVVMDYSWNHTGTSFWAWQDVLEKQQESKYANWYMIDQWDDPATEENEFAYTGWAGLSSLPELKKIDVVDRKHGHPYEGNMLEEVKQHIFNVSKRWLDPKGNGDLSKGIDGYRLDVADQIPMGFWRDYRDFVKGVNPEAILVGEIWWEEWPDHMMDPRPYVEGDVFDAVMFYQWYKPARKFFAMAEGGATPSQFVNELDAAMRGIDLRNQKAMMNLTASHDSPRFSTSFFNKNKYKYNAKPTDDPTYKTGRPDALTFQLMRMMLMHQYTFVGAPHIWNGDEMGMWGADDPDDRKPLLWDDITFENERYNIKGEKDHNDKVKQDKELMAFYEKLGAIRNEYDALVDGDLEFFLKDDNRMLLGYSRSLGDEKILSIFNMSDKPQAVRLNEMGTYHDLITEESIQVTDQVPLMLQPFTGTILLRENGQE